ncbi:SEC-C metal-binding domain-containing protein [Geotalea sp. SG265]|uniref:YecA family protein n=1 Tax=Geotalea sp. SG265 TaxID=2922867 RepID=UPI001FAF093F|nr:SEC-C metal-binding domain-containing protein [Geotalea sp. SG265]
MPIIKSEGVTPTEKVLAGLCERSFLKLWCYPNPLNEKGDELCDVLAVFGDHVFLFFDRESQILSKENKDTWTNWGRWKKKVVDAQIRTANGAERYIRSGRGIYLDRELKVPFPIAIDPVSMISHKIIIAHGAKKACEEFSDNNIYGSLAVTYGDNSFPIPFPFMISLDKENPVHVFDSHNLPILFEELDTFYDFSSYLDAKSLAIKKYDALSYCGEEDLLAHYFLNFDSATKRHFIGTPDTDINFVMIGEGEWSDFIKQECYRNKKVADKVSYLWDEIIQRTCENTLNGTLLGNSSPLTGRSPIHEMAKEPRFHRRALSEHMIRAIQNFPESTQPIMRNLTFMSSFYEDKGYVFLQLKVDRIKDYENEYRPKRQAMLRIACGAAKNKFPHLKMVIGIAIDAPKYSKRNSEDFILLDCSEWSSEIREQFQKENEGIGFLMSENLAIQQKTLREFPVTHGIEKKTHVKVGRNAPCPCGSGKKYKKCCINI